MPTIKRFEDIKVWQKARELCKQVFEIVNYPAFAKDFKLKDQINGSSGSTMDNIAEGFGRKGNKEFINFLTISSASSAEVQSQLYRALDRSYITQAKFNEVYKLCDEIISMIAGLIVYLQHSEYKGQKFKSRKIT